MSEQNGIQWLVEERDRLKARVQVLENELVRRDAAPPTPPEAFFVEVDYEVALRQAHGSKAIADLFVPQLAREVIARSLHRISNTTGRNLRLYFLATPLNVDSLSRT